MTPSKSTRTLSMESLTEKRPLSFRVLEFGGALAIIAFPVSISIAQFGLFLALAGWIAWYFWSRKKDVLPAGTWLMPFELSPEFIFALLIYISLFASLLIHVFLQSNLSDALLVFRNGLRGELKDMLLLTAGFWTLAYSRDERGKEKLYKWLNIAILILIISGLIAIFSKYRLAKLPYHLLYGWEVSSLARHQHYIGTAFKATPFAFHMYMPVGFMGTHLTYAAMLCFVLPSFFFNVVFSLIKRPLNLLNRSFIKNLIFLIIAVLILQRNGGRSAILGLIVALTCGLYYLLRTYHNRLFIPLFFLLLFFCISGPTAYFFSSSINKKIDAIALSIFGRGKHTDWQRLFVWQGTLELINENKLYGIGPGRFKEEMDQKTLEFSRKKPRLWYAYAILQRGHAHNDLLHLQAIGGISAAFFYLLFFFSLIYRLFQRSGSLLEEYWKWGILTIFIGGLFQCYFLDDEVLLPFWMLTALVIRSTKPKKALDS